MTGPEAVAPTADDWIRRFADRLGVAAPEAELVDALLGMAGIAAHASERTAAPISAWLAGIAGVTPAEALAAAGHSRRNCNPRTAPPATPPPIASRATMPAVEPNPEIDGAGDRGRTRAARRGRACRET
jgi:hypothetical protein